MGNSESRNKFSLSKYTKRQFFGVQESSSPSEKRSFVSTPSRTDGLRDEAIVGFLYDTIPGTAAHRSETEVGTSARLVRRPGGVPGIFSFFSYDPGHDGGCRGSVLLRQFHIALVVVYRESPHHHRAAPVRL